MGACPYIQPADYAAFGIPDAQAFQVDQASRGVDSYLGRPEGLLWSADANGQPAWMTGMTPSRTFAIPASVQPGQGVQVTIPFAQFGSQTVGEVVILDRANAQAAEACVVSAVSGNTLTLDSVQFAHPTQVAMDFGLTILQECRIKEASRRVVRVARWPLAQMMCAFGRFVPERRGSQLARSGAVTFPLAELAGGAAPPDWAEFSLSACDINYETGAVTIFPGLPQSGFNEARLRYVAGWQYATLPEAIKRATANLVRNAIDSADLPGNVRMVKSGDAAMEKFRDSVLDADTVSLLQPYRSFRV